MMHCSAAGAETSYTTLSWWTMAMIAFPEVQRRAQAEIDAVVGRDRLPSFADAPNLPYVCATMKEVLRWRPAVPLGAPHVAREEDWYEGMYIPKGTMCIANLWQCNHDRAVFGVPGPVETYQAGHVSFGFGRRICVGKDLANESLFINTARILWAAELARPQDESGKEVPLDIETANDAGII